MIQELPKRNWGGEKLIESFLQNERDIKVLGRIAVERLNFEHQRGSLHSMGKRWASKRVTGQHLVASTDGWNLAAFTSIGG